MLVSRPKPITKRSSTAHAAVMSDPHIGKANALVREFLSASGLVTQYKQYRRNGAPPNDLGTPGDMYFDTSPQAHRLFIRYESWREWYGVYQDSSQGTSQFHHPVDTTKTVWCSPTDVVWYKQNSANIARRRLFSRYMNVSFVSAHELIRDARILLRWEEFTPQIRVLLNGNNATPVTPSSNHDTILSPPFIQNADCSFQSQGVISPPPPSTSYSASNDINPGKSESSIRPSPARRPLIPDASQPSSSGSLTSNTQHGVQVISKHERAFETAGMRVIQYTLYHGLGRPPIDLGRPGDMFVDVDPTTYRLFVRYEYWQEWPGIYDHAGTCSDSLARRFVHPQDATRVVWCTQSEVMWYKNISVRLGKVRLFSSKPYLGAPFVSAHELIQRSGIPRRAGRAGWQLDDEDVTKEGSVKRRKTDTESLGDIDSDDLMPTCSLGSTRLHDLSIASSSTAIALAHGSPRLPTRMSSSPSPDIPPAPRTTPLFTTPQPSTNPGVDRYPHAADSRDTSLLSSVPDCGNQTRITSSTLELFHLRSSSPDKDNQGLGPEAGVDVKDDIGYAEAAKEARHSAEFKGKYRKQKAKYWKRKSELIRREVELAKQEEEFEEKVRGARMRLEKAEQDAVGRNEEIKRQEEELRRVKAELAVLEEKAFHRMQALKARKGLIEKMKESISRWEQV